MKLLSTRSIRFLGTASALFVIASTCLRAQPVDLGAGEVLSPSGTVSLNVPQPVRFVVRNAGDNVIGTYACNIIIVNQGNSQVVYTSSLQGPAPLAPGEEATLTAAQQWTPIAAGSYQVRLQVQTPNDIAPTNNQSTADVRVLLSLTGAIAILDSSIFNTYPRRDSVVVWLSRPPAAPLDSMIAPGLAIRPADTSFILQYEYPVYLFYIDQYPDMLYSHPVEFVTVSAVTGAVERRTAELWPVVNDEDVVFGPACGPNPNRVHGNAANCQPKQNPYNAVATANTADWAIAVAGKLNLDIEKTTVDHDICRWKERINGNTAGPGVTGPNISVNMGRNNCGLTKKEFCDALDALKGKACAKVFIKYVGHGTQRGLVFWNERHTDAEIVSYHEIACKLKEAGITNACIEITACHSGGIISELEKKGIKGVVITSSSKSNTTPVGDGSGTWWEKALEECSKDSLADVNEDGKIDLCELYAWVKAKGGKLPNDPNPQISKLNDSIKFGSSKIERVGSVQTVSTNQGSIKFYAERFCVKIKVKTGPGRTKDSVAYRGAVYMENDGATRKTSKKKYRVVARCRGGDRVIVDEIIPDVNPNSKICIANLPDDCTGIVLQEIKKRGTRKRDDDPTPLAADDAKPVESLTGASVHDDSTRYALYRYIIAADPAARTFTAQAAGPAGWLISAEPAGFTLTAGAEGDLFTAVVPVAGTEFGGEITTTLANTTTGDTLLLRYQMLLADTIVSDAGARFERRFNYVTTRAPAAIRSDTLLMEGTQIEAGDSLSIVAPSGSVWSIAQTIFDADSGIVAGFRLDGGTHNYHNVIVRGPATGLHLLSEASGELNGVVVGNSGGNGFTFVRANSNNLRMSFLDVIGAAGNGALFTGGGDTLRVNGLRVLLADSSDVVLTDTARVECTDCEYDDARVRTDGTGSLRRFATVSVAVRDTNDVPMPAVSVVITDTLGRIVFTGSTDTNGMVAPQRVLVSEWNGSSYTRYLPIAVTVRKGTEERSAIGRSMTYDQVRFVLNGSGSLGVPGERREGMLALGGVTPQPVRRTGTMTIDVAGADEEVLRGEILDALGRTVTQLPEMDIRDGRITIDISRYGVVSGLYVLRVVDGMGRRASCTFVVQ